MRLIENVCGSARGKKGDLKKKGTKLYAADFVRFVMIPLTS